MLTRDFALTHGTAALALATFLAAGTWASASGTSPALHSPTGSDQTGALAGESLRTHSPPSLFLQERFDGAGYTDGADLAGLAGGFGFDGPWTGSRLGQGKLLPGIVLGAYPSAGLCVRLVDTTLSRRMAPTSVPTTGGTLWVSYLLSANFNGASGSAGAASLAVDNGFRFGLRPGGVFGATRLLFIGNQNATNTVPPRPMLLMAKFENSANAGTSLPLTNTAWGFDATSASKLLEGSLDEDALDRHALSRVSQILTTPQRFTAGVLTLTGNSGVHFDGEFDEVRMGQTLESVLRGDTVVPLTIAPMTSGLSAMQTITFAASGGTGPYTFDYVRNVSAGTLGSSGQYTAGPRAGEDVIRVKDAAGQTALARVVVTAPTFRIEGTVTDPAGTPLSNVEVNLAGSVTHRLRTVNGRFEFDGLPAHGAYTVAPSLDGLDFGEARSFVTLSSNQIANFRAVAPAGLVQGRVAAIDGTPLANVTVKTTRVLLVGNAPPAGSAQTAADGTYRIDGLPPDETYRVEAVSSESTFTPRSISVSPSRGGARADFVAHPAFRISGQVGFPGGSPDGVTVRISRATLRGRTASLSFLGNVLTDADGRFTTPLLATGFSYSLVPSRSDSLFEPSSRLVEALSANVANADFSGISVLRATRGRVVNSAGLGVSGAVLRLTRISDPTFSRQTSTDGLGEFAFVGLPPVSDFILVAQKADFEISPASMSLNLRDADATDSRFTALGSFRLTGRVTTRAGEPLTSLQIRLLAFPSGQVLATAFTGTDGSYDLGTHRDGSEFTIRPQAAAFTFLPLSHRVENLNANRTLNFEAQRDHFVARANVRTSFGLKLPLVPFALLGAPTNQEVTYGVGSIQAVLPGGRTYTLTPLREGVTFSPPSITFGDLVADRVLEFTATPVLPLEGRITFVLGSTTAVMNADGTDVLTLPIRSRATSDTPSGGLDVGSAGPVVGASSGFDGLRTQPANGVVEAQALGNAILGSLTGSGSFSLHGALSPDGREIAMVTQTEVAGSGFQSSTEFVVRVARINEFGSEEIRRISLLGSPSKGRGQVEWSPDGTRLALSVPPLGLAREGLEILARDGGSSARVVGTLSRDRSATWSPTGSKLAFARATADAAGSASDIYTINAIGRADLTRLTNHDADDTDPAWSPDGSKIAFASNRNGHYDIYVMQANGLLETRITSTDADDRHPTWSPDGSMIAFDRTVAGGTNNVPLLYAMTASGANETFLMIGEEPSWSPTPTVAAPTGVASTLTAGGVTVTFAGVSSSDTSRDTTILPTAPAAPSDFAPGYVAIDGAGVSFEIRTAADYTPPVILCFAMTDIDDEDAFGDLAVLHAENGSLVDRTIRSGPRAPSFATRRICAQVDSLSPFHLAFRADVSKPSISGLLLDERGEPLAFREVRLGGSRSRGTLTDANGRFAFANLQSDADYTLVPADGGFEFSPPVAFARTGTGMGTFAFIGVPKVPIAMTLEVTLDPAAPDSVTLAWPDSGADISLEGTPQLEPPRWERILGPVTVSKGKISVTIQATNSSRFFRLLKR